MDFVLAESTRSALLARAGRLRHPLTPSSPLPPGHGCVATPDYGDEYAYGLDLILDGLERNLSRTDR